ncbi:rod shape-determining protein MreC [Gammaproteobacteria bacterium 45_16_T64]|nr:rod shape-determining protein MreC [Gammaproteobacteria bacterium 45_16_T64]
MKPIFSQNQANRYRLAFCAVLSIMLIFVDHRTDMLKPVRYSLSFLLVPIQYISDTPARIASWSSDSVKSRETLEKENIALANQVRLLERRVQKLASTIAENKRLKELMNSSAIVDDRVIVGEIIGVDPDPYRHEVIINKGARDDLYEGQAVLDADGLMGQIVEVGPITSRVLLISDTTHGLPVHANRNGVRAIAVGSGVLDKLKLIHVPDTADLKEGDLLVSSGLGGRFPKGYPVGVVSMVSHDPGQPFATVEARPTAHLDRSRYVLLVFAEDEQAVESEMLSGGEE